MNSRDHGIITHRSYFFIGDLLGYKIFYHVPTVNSRNAEEIEVVSASHTTHSLIFLEMYTNYSISILAFNPAGEGPRSDPVSVKTLQGIPEPPVDLKFNEITMNTLKVSWDPPIKPNGEILGYVVAYETAEQDESKFYFSKSVIFGVFLPFWLLFGFGWPNIEGQLGPPVKPNGEILGYVVAYETVEQDESKCY